VTQGGVSKKRRASEEETAAEKAKVRESEGSRDAASQSLEGNPSGEDGAERPERRNLSGYFNILAGKAARIDPENRLAARINQNRERSPWDRLLSWNHLEVEGKRVVEFEKEDFKDGSLLRRGSELLQTRYFPSHAHLRTHWRLEVGGHKSCIEEIMLGRGRNDICVHVDHSFQPIAGAKKIKRSKSNHQ